MRCDVVDREPVAILYAAAAGEPDRIPAAAASAFAALEAAIPPRGRKLYGYWAPVAREYRACYARREGEDAEALGLSEDVLPGGRYARLL